MVTANQAYLIPLLPLLAFVINILFGRYVKDKACWISLDLGRDFDRNPSPWYMLP